MCYVETGDLALVQLAARNNAEWCDAVCRTHGVIGTFHPDVWASGVRTPELYPDAVALHQSLSVERVLSYVDDSSGCSIKDSFGVMDLRFAAFRVLFEAEWIYLDSHWRPRERKTRLRWAVVKNASALKIWETAWAGDSVVAGIFLPDILRHPTVLILGGYVGDRVLAGGVINWSESVIGLSNVFAVTGDLGESYAGCLTAAVDRLPALPIVGYEAGDALVAAHQLGFRSVGRLSIWVKEID